MTTVTPTSRQDPYPSRLGNPPELIRRADPVVYPGVDGPLSAETADRFDRNGYLVLPSVFDADEVTALDAAVSELIERVGDARSSDIHIVRESDGDAVRSIFAFHTEPGPLADVLRETRLAGVARQILGSEVTVHQSRVNAKPPFHGAGFRWHSDFETWHTEDGMPAPRSLSASIALTDNVPYNGPLLVMPGSHHWFVTCTEPTPPANHQKSLEDQVIGSPDDASLSSLYERCGIDQCLGPAGSVTWFDSNLMHASASNVSPLPRRNLFIVFNSVENPLGEPFAAPQRRPGYLASRPAVPVG